MSWEPLDTATEVIDGLTQVIAALSGLGVALASSASWVVFLDATLTVYRAEPRPAGVTTVAPDLARAESESARAVLVIDPFGVAGAGALLSIYTRIGPDSAEWRRLSVVAPRIDGHAPAIDWHSLDEPARKVTVPVNRAAVLGWQSTILRQYPELSLQLPKD